MQSKVCQCNNDFLFTVLILSYIILSTIAVHINLGREQSIRGTLVKLNQFKTLILNFKKCNHK